MKDWIGNKPGRNGVPGGGILVASRPVRFVRAITDPSLCFCVSVSVPGGPDGRRDGVVLGEPEPPLHGDALSAGKVFPTRAPCSFSAPRWINNAYFHVPVHFKLLNPGSSTLKQRGFFWDGMGGIHL